MTRTISGMTLAAGGLMLGLGASVSHASPVGYCHTTSMPSQLSGFDKGSSAFKYLDLERSNEWGNGSLTATLGVDLTHTVGRSSGDIYWGASSIPFNANGDTAMFAARGGFVTYTDVPIYWTDILTGFATSQQFAVYLYTFTSGGADASQTFNFTIGTDNASADAASSLSSVTVTSATPAWYTLGAFTQTTGLDTFKLRMDSNKSPTQGDVILIAAVPEPGTTGILLAFGTLAGLLRRRRA